jgi:hypothetical protein
MGAVPHRCAQAASDRSRPGLSPEVTSKVCLLGCAITFAPGPADRITAVALAGPGARRGSVAGLSYLDTGSATPPSLG